MALAARRRDRLEELAAGIRDQGGTALVVECDISYIVTRPRHIAVSEMLIRPTEQQRQPLPDP